MDATISHLFDFVSGDFDMETGKLSCIQRRKYNRVDLCFAEGVNVVFAQIKLHSRDSFTDANAVFSDATRLGTEIVRRWNRCAELEQRPDVLVRPVADTNKDVGL